MFWGIQLVFISIRKKYALKKLSLKIIAWAVPVVQGGYILYFHMMDGHLSRKGECSAS